MESSQRGVGRAGDGGVHGGAREVAQLGEGSGVQALPVADDRDAVHERLDLAQDVAGEQHGGAAVPGGADLLLEHLLHPF